MSSKFEELEIHFHLSIGYSNTSQDDSEPLSNYITEEEWNAMSVVDREYLISKITDAWAENHIELSGWVG